MPPNYLKCLIKYGQFSDIETFSYDKSAFCIYKQRFQKKHPFIKKKVFWQKTTSAKATRISDIWIISILAGSE